MSNFEHEVTSKLATLEERTRDLADMRRDVSDIKGRVKLLEFKAGAFGAAAGAVIVAVKAWFGRG